MANDVLGKASIPIRARLDRLAADLDKARLEVDRSTERIAESASRRMASRLTSAGKRMTEAGRRISLGVTVPLTLMGAASFNAAATFEQTMRQVAQASGAPQAQLKSLSQLALRMGADTVFSAQDAGEAMLELAKGGMNAAQIKGGALQSTLTLAAAGGLQLGDAASYVVNGLNMFDLKAGDSSKVAAALAGGANASTASVQSLGLALSQVGPGADQAGLSLQETVGVLAAFDNAGIKGSDAGTSLKTMLLNLVPATNEARAKMSELGLSFVDSTGSIIPLTDVAQQLQDRLGGLSQAQQQAALKTIFGTDAYRAAAILMKIGAKGVDSYTKATSDLSAAQDMAKTRTQGAAGAVEQMEGSVETAEIAIGDALAPTVVDAAGDIQGLADAFSGMPPWLQKTTVAMAGLLAAAGPLNFALGGVASIAGRTIDGVRKVGDASRKSRAAVREFSAGMAAVDLAFKDGATSATRLGAAVSSQIRSWKQLGAAQLVAKVAMGGLATAGVAALAAGFGYLAYKAVTYRKESDRISDAVIRQTHAFSGNITNYQQAVTQLTRLRDKQAALAASMAKQGESLTLEARAADLYNSAQKEAANTAAGLDAKIRLITGNVNMLASTFGISRTEAVALAGRLKIDLSQGLSRSKEKIDAYKQAVTLSHHPAQQAAQDAKTIGDRSQQASTQVDALKRSFDALVGRFLDTDQARIRVENDLAQLTKNLKASKGATDLHTQASRDARQQFDVTAQSILDYATQTFKETGSVDKARAALNRYIPRLEQQGGKNAYVKGTVDKLHAAVDNLPNQHNIPITTPGLDAARKRTDDLRDKLHKLEGTYNVYVGNGITIGRRAASGESALAAGGPVYGPGGPTDDKAGLFALSNEEYVIRAASHRKYGTAFLDAINAGRFATGGPVGSRITERVSIPGVGDLLSFLGDLQSASAMVSGIPQSAARNAAITRSVAAGYGWSTGAEWNALKTLIMHESGFRNTAQNPTSTAYGKYQFLDSTWAGVGGHKTSNSRLQDVYGLRYIAGRYGDPIGAWSFWSRHHWYDAGGWMMPGLSVGVNGTGQPEAVLTAGQWSDIHTAAVRGGDGASAPSYTAIFNGPVQRPTDARRVMLNGFHDLHVLAGNGRRR